MDAFSFYLDLQNTLLPCIVLDYIRNFLPFFLSCHASSMSTDIPTLSSESDIRSLGRIHTRVCSCSLSWCYCRKRCSTLLLSLFICLCSPPIPYSLLIYRSFCLTTSSPHLCPRHPPHSPTPSLPPAQTINIMSRGWRCSFMEHCMFIRGRRSLREMLTVFINGPHPRLMRHGTS